MEQYIFTKVSDFLSHEKQIVDFRINKSGDWEKVLENSNYIPFSYTQPFLEYQLAYQRGQGGNWYDISLIFYWDNQPVAAWPLSYTQDNEKKSISSAGMEVMPPIFANNVSSNSVKKVVKACINFVTRLEQNEQVDNQNIVEFLNAANGLSLWYQLWMAQGAKRKVKDELYLYLNQSIVEIKSHLRKRYKSFINKGAENWNLHVLKEGDLNVWEAYRQLHYHVAGKVTRSKESWDIQLHQIEKGDGFLVYLTNDEEKMVGGGFFNVSRDEGIYAVGAYDRSLFDMPLGHVVQYYAIQEMQARGIQWYKIGERCYQSDLPEPTEKEISIADFKQGFASHLYPKFILYKNKN